jgi:anhydro-N-acetylmuramic acid kinase
MKVAGIMSGTSLDGIDVAIVDIVRKRGAIRIAPVAFRSTPYPTPIREALLAVSNSTTHTATIARLNFLLGELYALALVDTCRRVRVPLASIELCGMHGQTIFHEGSAIDYLGHRIASTLQIGEAAVVAQRTGIRVISNFRERDIAAGGQGAPLVPYVDYLLFRDRRIPRIALNIGGIANITVIPRKRGLTTLSHSQLVISQKGPIVDRAVCPLFHPAVKPAILSPAGKVKQAILSPAVTVSPAFDTGPGNMVIDALVAHHSRGRQLFDRDGRIARSGKVDESLLKSLLRDPYLALAPPKSCGREQYGPKFVNRLIASKIPLPDLIATATEFTVRSIARAISDHAAGAREVIVSGGGVHNSQIMRRLRKLLPDLSIDSSRAYGIDPDAKEAVAFAILAYEHVHGRPGNLPPATGARHAVLLGKSSPAS